MSIQQTKINLVTELVEAVLPVKAAYVRYVNKVESITRYEWFNRKSEAFRMWAHNEFRKVGK